MPPVPQRPHSSVSSSASAICDSPVFPCVLSPKNIERQVAMPHKPPDLGPAKTRAAPTDPFDIWLSRGLHSLYSAVTAEPIPPELLRLIDGLPEKAVARATGPPSSPRDLGGAMAAAAATYNK